MWTKHTLSGCKCSLVEIAIDIMLCNIRAERGGDFVGHLQSEYVMLKNTWWKPIEISMQDGYQHIFLTWQTFLMKLSMLFVRVNLLHYATYDTRLMHSHRKLRKILKCCAWRLILKHSAWRVISKHCARRPSDARQTQLFKTLRLTPARHQPDVTFRNQASSARFQNMRQTLYSVTMRQTCSTSLAMYIPEVWKIQWSMKWYECWKNCHKGPKR